MSGGVAYVLDIDGTFAANCNIDMVDLDRLEDDEEASARARTDRAARRC